MTSYEKRSKKGNGKVNVSAFYLLTNLCSPGCKNGHGKCPRCCEVRLNFEVVDRVGMLQCDDPKCGYNISARSFIKKKTKAEWVEITKAVMNLNKRPLRCI